MTTCYDFPEAVMHDPEQTCPRYAGGVCRPLPTPVEPYTDEELVAVKAYEAFCDGSLHYIGLVRATGTTLFPPDQPKEVQ